MCRRGRILALMTLAAIQSCSVKPVMERVTDVGTLGWKPEVHHAVVHLNSDTLSLRRITVFARAERSFDDCGETLPLVVTCIAPDGKSFTCPVRLSTAENSERVSFIELSAIMVDSAKLALEGLYVFDIAPLTDSPVKGVWGVGVQIRQYPAENGKR